MTTLLNKQPEDPMLFPWIEKKKKEILEKKSLQKKDLINLGIGDICHPLPKTIIDALHAGVEKMGHEAVGYGPEQGRKELRSLICEKVYSDQSFNDEEIFITEGIANSLSILMSLFKEGSTIGVLSPTYPVYKSLLKTYRMNIVEINAGIDLKFPLPEDKLDGMILCSPNNPTGEAFSKQELEKWVAWAKETGTLILFDGAYEAFVEDINFPRSIYEVSGAKDVAIELRSFSKSIGFTGLRLGYFVYPKNLKAQDGFSLSNCTDLICSKTNGVSYLIQEAAIAALSDEAMKESKALTEGYMSMTQKLKDHLLSQGEIVVGGNHAPYLFWKVEGNSKDKFLHLLETKLLVTVPGVGFGMDGYLRLSGFINEEILARAIKALT
jgi:LL-diaminopimelate aminotransferase